MTDRSRILIVGENAIIVDTLRRLLRVEYEIKTADCGEACLKLIPSLKPDLILLDTLMSGLSGYETCRRIKESPIGELTQVILISGKSSSSERLKGCDAGADDFLVSPLDQEELLSKVRIHCRLRDAQVRLFRTHEKLEVYSAELDRIVHERTAEVVAIRDMTVFALAELAESRDEDTGSHLIRIRAYSQILAEQLQLNRFEGYEIDDRFLADLYRASPLHDIGKVGVPDSILRKPGRLTDDEREQMKKHVLFGARTLDRAMRQGTGSSGEFLAMAADVARYHHERWDGNGYCAGLRHIEIPLAARIVALADVFDALTSKRCYKQSQPPDEVCEIIEGEKGAHFDPVIVTAFQESYPRFLDVMRKHGDQEIEPASVADAEPQPCAVVV